MPDARWRVVRFMDSRCHLFPIMSELHSYLGSLARSTTDTAGGRHATVACSPIGNTSLGQSAIRD
eukprot:4572652-Pyramimonas_sp.AAC.2